jgi:cytochrome c biogenesis factor
MPAYELKDQSMSLQVVVNPLVSWIWMGFGILVLGTGIALLPERAFEFALGRVPAGATTT